MVSVDYRLGFSDAITQVLDLLQHLETDREPVARPNSYRMGRAHGSRTMQVTAINQIRQLGER